MLCKQTALCHTCQEPMELVAEDVVHGKFMHVFHCKWCDKYEAAEADRKPSLDAPLVPAA